MIKLIWYFISLLTILLILFNSPSSNSMNNFMSQNKFLNVRSNQMLIQKFIVVSILLFIIFTILCSIYIKT
uniref:Preprotein-translocase subunit g n=1 Tax=Dipterocladia arabiensis TaxID=2007176 RepID=A0A1Z1M0W1_9FLOR|nr:preprotein-translocase subunit g [Dipterocladia arabiensis]ARW59405.1 preprotein-translocase subunit g [Dipterocladia arabiensis]